MISALRLTEGAIVREYTMANLGKINVICGKNNSGKSTLLAMIADPMRRTVGKPWSDSDNQAIHQAIVSAAGLSSAMGSREAQAVDRILSELVPLGEIRYRDQRDAFKSELSSAFQNSRLRRSNIGFSSIANVYQELFSTEPATVVVPPKRSLELERPLNLGEEVTPAGVGILNYLFFASNQPSTSQDYGVYQSIRKAFSHISAGYSFQVFPDRNNHISVNFSAGGSQWIRAEDCGLGLQDLIVILYFAIAPGPDLVLLEEPESHLHPEMQKQLLLFLRNGTSKQYFLTTHSNVFLNNALIDRVFFTSFDGRINIDDATRRASILDDLGYAVTDNLVSDLVILVEGPTDVPVVEEFLLKTGVFSMGDIRIWPLGGDIMDQVDLNVFAEKYKLIALLDQDPGSKRVRNRFEKRCRELGIPVHRLKRYGIESYFSLRALREVFGSQIPSTVESLDPSIKLENQIGINVRKNNRNIAKVMTLDEIETTDFNAFIRKVAKRLSA